MDRTVKPNSIEKHDSSADHDSTEGLREYLRNYYGKMLKRTEDLSRKACCADDTKLQHAETLRLIPGEVKERNYGCGCSIPQDDLTGLTVLDLGSGAGLDAFIMARLVGEQGNVYGVDMTNEQLEVARRNIPEVMNAFGYGLANVEFHEGYIETADAIPDDSIDLVISDCTVNLSPRKEKVFETIFRVLRTGGEFFLSDIVADRRVPEAIAHDPQLIAECLGGALYEHDFLDIIMDAGFGDPRVVVRKLVEEDVNGYPIRFYSATVRGFKLGRSWDRRCEDYGQVAIYRGSCALQPARFVLDDHHVFEAGCPVRVCRNTARMLSETRLSQYFEVTSPRKHLGLFDCGSEIESSSEQPCC